MHAIRVLNRDWRNLDKPTNVLSFPAAAPRDGAPEPLLGDIVIAYETVARESARNTRSSFIISPISRCMAFCISWVTITRLILRLMPWKGLNATFSRVSHIADPYRAHEPGNA